MTVLEAAEMAGVSRATFYGWLAQGIVPCVRIGRRYRLQPDAFAAWLSGRQSAPEQQPGVDRIVDAIGAALRDGIELTIMVRAARP